jgi:CHAP domain.
MTNCVGYVWSRFFEIVGSRQKLAKGNAENMYNGKDGYKRGQTPKLGAVACWRKGKAGNEKVEQDMLE